MNTLNKEKKLVQSKPSSILIPPSYSKIIEVVHIANSSFNYLEKARETELNFEGIKKIDKRHEVEMNQLASFTHLNSENEKNEAKLSTNTLNIIINTLNMKSFENNLILKNNLINQPNIFHLNNNNNKEIIYSKEVIEEKGKEIDRKLENIFKRLKTTVIRKRKEKLMSTEIE